MPLVTLDEIHIEFGDHPILRGASLVIEENERLCLIGRNGAGKSTLLKIITGELEPDSGEIVRKQELRISQLAQALPDQLHMTVYEYVEGGLTHLRQMIDEYHRMTELELDRQRLRELENLQHCIEAEGGWHIDQRVKAVLSELDLPGDKTLQLLSGGWQRRVGLARALVSSPELLLLDEPTNHLDLASIRWLEARIRNFKGAVLFITHDRAFLNSLATRLVELDRTRLTSWPGNYRNYLRRKEEALHAEEIDKNLFEKKLAEEEAWIRQGIKARRTRNEGRVRALLALREEAGERARFRRQPGARIHIESSENESGRKVCELHRVSYAYGEDMIINRLDLSIRRGDRIGLVGNNGVGKSTLLNLILGRLQPCSGTVKTGTGIEPAYFDQMRRELDPEKTIAEVIGDGREYIRLNGKDRHVIGYLRGFLFSAKRAMTPIKAISGGEKNRVILARLFTRPSNLLVLDEPTNDLDIETLEVLEQKLIEYRGTLILVSHDREFLDNVVTSVLVFEDDRINRYAGGYSDWLNHGRHLTEKDKPAAGIPDPAVSAGNTAATGARRGRLSYKYQLELDRLPDEIEALEQDISKLQEAISDPGFYSRDYDSIQPVMDELSEKQRQLDTKMQRWEELAGMAG